MSKQINTGFAISPIQRRVWQLSDAEGSLSYRVRGEMRIEGELDRERLRKAVEVVVGRHEALRTSLQKLPGISIPVQVVDERTHVTFEEPESPANGRIDDGAAGVNGGLYLALTRESDGCHRLRMSAPSVCLDETSINLVACQIAERYLQPGAESSEEEADLLQYPDVSEWLIEAGQAEEAATGRGFWKEIILASSSGLRPLRKDPDGTFAIESVNVEPAEEASAKVLAGETGGLWSASAFILCAWAVVLEKLRYQEESLVAVGVDGRSYESLERVVGPLTRYLPLALAKDRTDRFVDLQARAAGGLNQAAGWQECFQGETLGEEQSEGSLAVYVPFAFDYLRMKTLPGNDQVRFSLTELSGCVERFDIRLSCRQKGERLHLFLNWANGSHSREEMERVARGLATVLEQVAIAPETRLCELRVVSRNEQKKLVEELNRSAMPYSGEKLIHEQFAEQAKRTPQAEAVRYEGAGLAYRELDRRAEQLAACLRNRGVGPESLVGICLERSPEMVIALLGVLKAGAAYVPLDPGYPEARLEYMLRSSGARLVVSTGPAAEKVRGVSEVEVVRLGAVDESAGTESRQETGSVREVSGENPAYVIFTSGSTGTPKAVVVTHGAIRNHMVWMQREFPLSTEDRVLQKTAFSFDASVWEFYAPLLAGGCLVMARPGGQQDAEYLLECIEREQITVLQLVPSQLRMLLDMGGLNRCVNLKRVYCGGEALEQALVNEFFRQLPAARLFNLYGPTEVTIDATWAECHSRAEARGMASIGKGVANIRLYLLDEDGQLVPPGVAGELCLGGAGVARGYLHRPDLTAERFIPDAWGPEGGKRLYRTGDLARWSAEGTLEFLGRNDGQVKLRGFRIEPGEIEARLKEYAGVAEALVMVREDLSGEKRLVAWYTAGPQSGEQGEGNAGAEQLREHMAARLPEYMVPAAYVRLDAMPLTVNGKLDRKALPLPEGGAYALRRYEAPQGEIETAVAAIWAEGLKLEQVGRDDNFFQLGGHSLLAVGVISRVRQNLSVKISLADLFAHPRLADFAREVTNAAHAELPPITRSPRCEKQDLSFAQQRLWFIAQMSGASRAYHIPIGFRLLGEINSAVLRRALDRIVARHEALRTTFVAVDGEPVQRIAPLEESGFHLIEQNLEEHPGGVFEELARLVEEETRAPFDLENGPLIRGRLVRLGPSDHALLITMHHIISDGWSTGLLLDELSALYGAFVRGEADLLPEPELQYADYAAWQRQWMEGEVLGQQAAYWKSSLQGAPGLLELPWDYPRPREKEYAGAFLRLKLDGEVIAGLKRLSQRQGATLYMTLLAGWAVLLGRLSAQQDVVIGTPVANRGRREIEKLIGFFVNTLAVRVDLSGSPTVARLVERVKQQAVAGQQYQDIPFEQVVEILQPQRNPSHTPVFQSMFAWQNTPPGSLELPAVEVRPLASAPHVVAKFDLTLGLELQEDTMRGGVEYATSLFDPSTVERWLGYFRNLLEAMPAGDNQRIDDLPLMSAAEREQIVKGWNATAVEYEDGLCMHELFERQVSRTPNFPAVVCDGHELSYRELDRRANQLANYLRNVGVGPEVRVGICVVRSLDMVVGLLGILKAGGAYVPLDHTYPAERLAYMLEDSKADVVLTQSGLLVKLPRIGATVVCLDRQWNEIARESGERPAGSVTAENLAYIYYTSGSTGRPKGVAMAHSGIVNYILWGIEAYEAGGGKESLGNGSAVHSSIAVDLTLTNFLALFTGKSVVLVPERPGVEALVELMQARPDWSSLKVTPTHLTMLNARLTPEEMKHITRVLIIGADNLVAEPTLVWRQHAPHVKLWNEYGPTETVVGCSIFPIGEDAPRHGGMPIGKPIANITMYVLDRQGEPLPAGVPGELYIGGTGVARGYWGKPDLTAARFVPDKFAGIEGARFYRTGDRARFLRDGNLEFLGRVDNQVKIRGYRIEPEEVEAVLSGFAGVRKAMVVVREDVPGEKRLVGYVAAPGGEVQPSELRRYLKERLPEYMVPVAWVIMDELPVGSSGKIDPKVALPRPGADAFAVREYEAPRGAVEEMLAEIWAELLGVDRVGRDDNFFDLGGHSLLAVRVIARARRRLMLETGISDLFAYPVLSDFASHIEGAARVKLPPITRAERGGRLPLSLAQQRLWFLARMEGMNDAYHVPLGVRLKGKLHREALRRALDRIVVRHEALRSTFVEVDGEPEQRITPAEESAFLLQEQDLRGDADVEAELQRAVVAEATAPFNLETGPLVRGRLLRLGDEEHALVITIYHIVSDGWSMGILFRELNALYAAYAQGESDSLPPLEVQYVDYAIWQQKWMEGDILRQQGEYWKKTLSGAPAVLELPADHARPARADYHGALETISLTEELTAGLKELGRSQGTTLYMTVLAGWVALLARLSGHTDVVVGTHYANRGHVEIENLIGFFVNNLPVRLDVAGVTVEQLLARVKEQALGAQLHSEIPFEQVVEIMAPARSLAHNPIFQVMFAWQNVEGVRLDLPGLSARFLTGGDRRDAKFDLTLTLGQKNDRLVGGLEYAAALFEPATIRRYLGYFQTLLEGMPAGPGQTIDRLPMLSASERHQLLYGWNATQWDYPRDQCMHELFEEQAAQTPAAPAVVFEGRELTYGDLNRQANRLAHYLREQGVGPDARVGICVERSVEMAEAVMGVLKAEGAYVPLDPAYPDERLKFMLEDSRPRLVLTQSHLRERIQDLSGSVRVVDLNHDEDWADRPEENLKPEGAGRDSKNLAYMIYTSGSTGRPKGVMVEHRAWANLILRHVLDLLIKPGDRVMQFVSFGFDVWGEVAMTTLCGGASLYLVSSSEVAQLESLAKVFEISAITHLFLPAPILTKLSEHAASVSAGTLTTGGERLNSETAKSWGKGRRLINEYGPTETTVSATLYEFKGDETGEPPIGRPIANARIYILDEIGEPVPIGVAGEIFVGGLGVARGYWQNPDLTAEKFLPDPFTAESNGRMYRTGDLGRWLADGNIEFLGRNDHQVKVRGYRIELGEIEARLMEHEGVAEAVVEARESSGEKRLVVYYTVREGEEVGAEQLRAGLAAKLPDYMVPAAYVRLESMPLTAHAKVDRRALPAPESDAYAVREYEAPRGEVEETLAEIWAELLGVGRVGRNDNFFELGGHSLLAVRVMSRLQQWLGVEAGLTDLFAHPCLADFAACVEGSVKMKLSPITRADRSSRIPLSFTQQRLWFLAQMEGAGDAYHMPLAMRLKGEIDRGALRSALDRVMFRHEALRTTFVAVDGDPVQCIAPAEKTGIHLRDLDLRGRPDMEIELERAIAEEASAAFDLTIGPLIRGCLVTLGERDHALLITLHHIVTDGWSMGVLLRELNLLYDAFLHGEADPLPALDVQYADYAVWQRKWMERGVLADEAEYWRKTLAGAPALLELPWDHARPAETDYAGAFVPLVFDKELSRNLKVLSRRHGATLFMTLLAGWAAVLARLSGQQEVVIGTPVANRGRSEVEGLIGFFLNMLAMRIDLSGSPSVAELLEQTRNHALAAQENQNIPFEQVVEIVRPVRSMSHTPVFQVIFAWQNALDAGIEFPGVEVKYLPLGNVMAKFDLELGLRESGDVIAGGVTYATALFERATVERYLEYFRAQLAAMAADESLIYDRLPLMGAAERERVLNQWNGTGAAYPKEKCVYELFEEQVDRTPQAVALVYEESVLRYGELNRQANRLAHYLRSLGVKPDTRVGICVERGLEMATGLLGIWKSGGAYVPLDPAYPAERLTWMLEDSAPEVLLTQRHLRERFADVGKNVVVVVLEDDAAKWQELPESNPPVGATGLNPEHLAYMIYTSGSTGRPKGVMVTHRGLGNVLEYARESFAVSSGDVMVTLASYAFDISLLELVTPWLAGATSVIVGREKVLDVEHLLEEVRGATILHTVPSLMRQLLGAWQSGQEKQYGSKLRQILIGGEAVAGDLLREMRERFPESAIRVLYGPTETTIICAQQSTDGKDIRNLCPIGRPISNARLYILDGNAEPVPLGVVGEVYIGGVGVARGYWQRPELTAERFLPDPFADDSSVRMYRTGDLGRRLADGNIEFLGRNDHQVKIRGFRIELGEIEARLMEHASVGEAVVVAGQAASGEKRLVAYYTVKEGAETSAEHLRARVAAKLPEYMVPAAYVRLERLPLTANGKLDRQALPAPEGDAFAVREYEAPQGEVEVAMAEIWAELLGVERVGRNDNFFELGGHSLLAVRVVARLRRRLGLEVDLRVLYEAATLAGLAAHAAPPVAAVDVPPNKIPAIEQPADQSWSDIEINI